MNLISFIDELVKIGATKCLVKRSADVAMSDPPAGMMDPSAPPPVKRVAPDESSTRLLNNHLPSQIKPGALGPTAESTRPIDQERYNRPYVERR